MQQADIPVRSKPILSSNQAQNLPKEDNSSVSLRLQSYFRYRVISLIKGCKKNYYAQELSKGSVKKSTSQKSSVNRTQIQSNQDIITGLNRLCLVKSKYKHREKVNFNRCQVLKLMNYDSSQTRKRIGSKEYQQMYGDLEDEDKKDEDKKFQVDPRFGRKAFQEYKKGVGIDVAKKVFVVSNYKDLTKYLLQIGWHENPDIDSLFYDFKFITRARRIDNVNLMDDQVINHFDKSSNLTTKFGLCRNLRNLVALGQDPDRFYPRCYDLYDAMEFDDWIEEFKFSKVVAILKSSLDLGETQLKSNSALLNICMHWAEVYSSPLPQKIHQIEMHKYPVIPQTQWQFIQNSKKIDPIVIGQEKSDEFVSKQGIVDVLSRVSEFDTQTNLNKENIWIVKPGSKSRGRGIKAFSDLNQILDYVIGKDDEVWVVQKYIENPLIIKNRKFDIRQWIVITDLKPLRIWAYRECYVRFSAQEYTTVDITNRFAHLTNNSVAKYSQNFDNDEIKGNMYFQDQLSQVVKEMSGQDLFPQLKEQMFDIIAKSVKSASQMLIPRKNSLEMFGYDFMIDTDFRPWLIEINSSPSMEHSTHVTSKLVPEALRGFGQLVSQYMMGGKLNKEPIGGWKLIYNK